MTAAHEWNTEMPPTEEIATVANDLGRRGFDVHTVTIILNGSHGGFDVTLQSTDYDMCDHEDKFILGKYGSLEEA